MLNLFERMPMCERPLNYCVGATRKNQIPLHSLGTKIILIFCHVNYNVSKKYFRNEHYLPHTQFTHRLDKNDILCFMTVFVYMGKIKCKQCNTTIYQKILKEKITT